MRRAKWIYPLLLFMSAISLVSFTFASISFDGGGIRYVAANKGDIMFTIDYEASKMYFEDGFLMINNFDGLFSSIGFSCDTALANITITQMKSDKIAYTVNAPTSTTSTTKIYVGDKGKPFDVTGASSWSYNKNLKTVSVDVEHNSPAHIIVEWENLDDATLHTRDIGAQSILIMGLMSTVMIVAGAVGMFSILKGGNLDYQFILFIMECALATVFVVFILGAIFF